MFQRIVVPLDGSCLAEWALPHAISLTKALGAQLVLMRVIQHEDTTTNGYPADPVAWEAVQAEADAYLDNMASRLGGLGLDAETITLEGEAVDQIIDYVRSDGNTLLVMTSHGVGGISHYMLGSVAHKSVLQAHVSFLLVRAFSDQCGPLEEYRYNRIVVPLDGSTRAECVLPAVEMLARYSEGNITLVSVVEAFTKHFELPSDDARLPVLQELDSEQRLKAEQYLNGIGDRFRNEGLQVQSRVEVEESPVTTIWDLTRKDKTDLVVMAAHGHTCVNFWPLGALPLNALVYGESPLLVLQDLEPHEIEPTFAEKAAREVWGH
ncbi:universal stress protein [Marinobacteraceae bacterium S3BR75-40.1]